MSNLGYDSFLVKEIKYHFDEKIYSLKFSLNLVCLGTEGCGDMSTVEDRYRERLYSAFHHYSANSIPFEKTLISILNNKI